MPENVSDPSMQFRPPNFIEGSRLYLVRCYVCGGPNGRENYAPAVASGSCAWCGWTDPRSTTQRERFDFTDSSTDEEFIS